MRWIALAIALFACSPASPDAPTDGTDAPDDRACGGDPTRAGLVTRFRFVRPDDQGAVDGFDLDRSAARAADACGIPDHVAPDGTPGIDAGQLGVLPVLEATEAWVAEEVINDAVATGDNLLLWSTRGAGADGQGCADVTLYGGAGAPMLNAGGGINPGETFAVAADVAPTTARQIDVADGHLRRQGFHFDFPFRFLQPGVRFWLHASALELQIHEDGSFEGMIAGSVDTAPLVQVLVDAGVGGEALDEAHDALRAAADLRPDEAGPCGAHSVTFRIEGVKAYITADEDPGS